MAKVRAYKIAEELGMDRNEFVAKAHEFGVELRSAMASVEEADAELLRRKLGKATGVVSESHRVETKGGSAVIRRRKKVKAPEPVEELPAPTPEEDVAPVEALEPPVESVATAAEEAAEPIAELAEPGTAEAAGLIQPAVEPVAPGEEAKKRTTKTVTEVQPEREKKRVRKRVVVEGNLQEQERLARQVTGRRSTEIAPTVTDVRNFVSPRRKRRDALPKKMLVKQEKSAAKRVVKVDGTINVQELANQLGQKAPVVQGKLMALGTMASINQTLDYDLVVQLAAEYGYETRNVGFSEEEALGASVAPAEDAQLESRPPIITVMGHVDHGKTSLLDTIRKANVTDGEAGGITQHIGAYQVSVGDSKLSFIDTPGHAAFTAMRARGANATDIVVLVVAASEGPMPQTVESINHARAAGVPIIVAVNKCDLPDAKPDITRQRLLEHELVPEEFGGEVLCVDVSAKTGMGIDKLLETITLQAEILELKADPNRAGAGIVLEARLDRGRGPVASILVQSGKVKKGNYLVAGTTFGRIRALHDENGKTLKEAGPSRPAEVLGLSGVPEAGQACNVVDNERAAKELVAHREGEARKESDRATRPKVSLDDLFAQVEGTGPKELKVVLKADVQGSAEALKESLLKLSTDKVSVNVIQTGVGGVTESDVMLAAASDAIIVGFAVRPDATARKAADRNGVDVRLYKIIYEALDEIRAAMVGLLEPIFAEVVLGTAEVREVFVIPKVGSIAGCFVTDGLIKRNALGRVVRDGVLVYESKLSSLRRFKDDVSEVKQGFECGIGIEKFSDMKAGDLIEVYEMEERQATLE